MLMHRRIFVLHKSTKSFGQEIPGILQPIRIQRSHLGQCKVQYVAVSWKGEGGLETVKTRVSGLNACISKKRWKGGYERRYSKYRKLRKD